MTTRRRTTRRGSSSGAAGYNVGVGVGGTAAGSTGKAAAATAIPKWASVILPGDKKKKKKPARADERKRKGADDDVDEEKADLIRREEEYLRTRSYHALSRGLVDRAWYETLKRSVCEPVVAELERMVEATSAAAATAPSAAAADDDENDDDKASTPDPVAATAASASTTEASVTAGDKQDDDDDDLIREMTMGGGEGRDDRDAADGGIDRRRYNPLLLPVLLMHGPPCQPIDRQEYMKHIVLHAKDKRQQKTVPPSSSAAVWLRKITGLRQITRQEEVVRQCLLQEPDEELLADVVAQKTKKKRNKKRNGTGGSCIDDSYMSLTDMLVSWASQTQAFDNIVVFLESSTGFYGDPSLQTFVQWLSERRALQGIPFVLVMMGPSSSVLGSSSSMSMQLPSSSSCNGPVGWYLRHLTLPSPKRILDEVWDRLCIEYRFPFVLPTVAALQQQLRRSFVEETGSAVHIVLKIKQILAHLHLSKGSFLVTASCPVPYCSKEEDEDDTANEKSMRGSRRRRHLLHGQRDRIKWFCLDPDAREVIQGVNIVKDNDKEASKAVERIERWLVDMDRRRRDVSVAMQVSKLLADVLSAKGGGGDHIPYFLRPSRSDFSSFQSSRTTSAIQDIATTILPVLAKLRSDCEITGDNTSTVMINKLIVVIGNCTLTPHFQCAIEDIFKCWRKVLLHHHDPSKDEMDAVASLSIEPRRQTVAGMLDDVDRFDRPEDELSDVFCIAKLPGCLYSLILRDRVSITREEWFGMFREAYASRIPLQEACSLFACGICSLKIAGLIRERRSTNAVKDNTTYFKTALVWCGGD